MVSYHHRVKYGIPVPYGSLAIWYFITVEVSMVSLYHMGACLYGMLSLQSKVWYPCTIWEPVHMGFSHHRVKYGVLVPYQSLSIWYFATIAVTYGMSYQHLLLTSPCDTLVWYSHIILWGICTVGEREVYISQQLKLEPCLVFCHLQLHHG